MRIHPHKIEAVNGLDFFKCQIKNHRPAFTTQRMSSRFALFWTSEAQCRNVPFLNRKIDLSKPLQNETWTVCTMYYISMYHFELRIVDFYSLQENEIFRFELSATVQKKLCLNSFFECTVQYFQSRTKYKVGNERLVCSKYGHVSH